MVVSAAAMTRRDATLQAGGVMRATRRDVARSNMPTQQQQQQQEPRRRRRRRTHSTAQSSASAPTRRRRRLANTSSPMSKTRISIQTAGLAFDGTGLCSYRDSCAKHLTVESYMVIYARFSSPTFSFISDLKPSFSANPSYCSLSFSSSELTT